MLQSLEMRPCRAIKRRRPLLCCDDKEHFDEVLLRLYVSAGATAI